MAKKLDRLVNCLQHVEESKRVVGLSYEDLCMHPDVELSEGYNPPSLNYLTVLVILRPICDVL